jgi:hypothetical protein
MVVEKYGFRRCVVKMSPRAFGPAFGPQAQDRGWATVSKKRSQASIGPTAHWSHGRSEPEASSSTFTVEFVFQRL